jgi:hypothetical protein
MVLHKEYHKTNKANTEIKFSVSFNREKHSWATGQPKKVGYQVTVVPVEITRSGDGITIESFTAFSGFNDCLLETDRQSKNRLANAISILQKNKERYLKHFKNLME